VFYTFSAVEAKCAIDAYPKLLRPIFAPFFPEVKKLQQYKKRGGELLKPIIDAQLAKEGDEKLHRDDASDEQGTFLSWLLSHMKEEERSDPYEMAKAQINISFASIHTTTKATTAAIYDLATYPELIEELREEIQQVLDEDGYDVDGNGFKMLKKSSMPKLWKLDSFQKESQRLSPPGLLANIRLTRSPITLSTGHTLPKGTRFAFPAWAIHNMESTSIFAPTPSHTPSPPSTFDGLRYYHLRKIPGNENKHQFATTSPESLSFGHGNHACPGRFFASNEIKIILIELLQNWDFRFKGDVERKGGMERRPETKLSDFTVTPNMGAELEFRRRKE